MANSADDRAREKRLPAPTRQVYWYFTGVAAVIPYTPSSETGSLYSAVLRRR